MLKCLLKLNENIKNKIIDKIKKWIITKYSKIKFKTEKKIAD